MNIDASFRPPVPAKAGTQRVLNELGSRFRGNER